jgi:energy-coupling factor transport system ATP-binding protein
VLVDGSDIRTTAVHELAKTVGYVFQNPNHQLFAQTVQEELSFGPKNQGLSASEVQSRVESALAFFEIGDLGDTHPLRLSFPMRKLVCIASVYAMNPAILILDEPTTGQDHSGMRLIKELIGRVRNEGRTVVLVSHDMPLVAEVAERLIVLCDGEVVDDDDPREVFGRNELLEKTHLQPPQVTQLSQRLLRAELPKLALTVDELVSSLSGLLGSQSNGEQSRQDGGA